MKRVASILEIVASLALIFAAGVVVWPKVGPKSAPPPSPALGQLADFSGRPIKGNVQAPVGIIEFSDFECPFCGRFSTSTLPELDKNYLSSGKAFLVFRHLPLTSVHPNAMLAARAGSCAHAKGHFWPLHDLLFSDPKSVDREAILRWGSSTGVAHGLQECMNAPRSDVDEDVSAASALQIRTTPTFLVGRTEESGRLRIVSVINGFKPMSAFAEAIDAAGKPR